MAGTVDKVKGTLKEAVGKMAGNDRLEAEGKADQAKGHAKDMAQTVSDTVKGVGDSLKREGDRH